MTDTAATPSTTQDTIEIARRKLQTLALNPMVDEAFRQYEETVAALQRELAEARAEIDTWHTDYGRLLEEKEAEKDAQARELEAARAVVDATRDLVSAGYVSKRLRDALAALDTVAQGESR